MGTQSIGMESDDTRCGHERWRTKVGGTERTTIRVGPKSCAERGESSRASHQLQPLTSHPRLCCESDQPKR